MDRLSDIAKTSLSPLPRGHDIPVHPDDSIHLSPEARAIFDDIMEGIGVADLSLQHPFPRLQHEEAPEEELIEEVEESRRSPDVSITEYATTKAPLGHKGKDPRIVDAFNQMLNTSTHLIVEQLDDTANFEEMERAIEEEMKREGHDPYSREAELSQKQSKKEFIKAKKRELELQERIDQQMGALTEKRFDTPKQKKTLLRPYRKGYQALSPFVRARLLGPVAPDSPITPLGVETPPLDMEQRRRRTMRKQIEPARRSLPKPKIRQSAFHEAPPLWKKAARYPTGPGTRTFSRKQKFERIEEQQESYLDLDKEDRLFREDLDQWIPTEIIRKPFHIPFGNKQERFLERHSQPPNLEPIEEWFGGTDGFPNIPSDVLETEDRLTAPAQQRAPRSAARVPAITRARSAPAARKSKSRIPIKRPSAPELSRRTEVDRATARANRPRDWRTNMKRPKIQPVPEPLPPLVVRATARETRRTAWKEPSLSTVKLPKRTPRPEPSPVATPVDRATARETRRTPWKEPSLSSVKLARPTPRPVPEPPPVDTPVDRPTIPAIPKKTWEQIKSILSAVFGGTPVSSGRPSTTSVRSGREPPPTTPVDRATARETRRTPWKEPSLSTVKLPKRPPPPEPSPVVVPVDRATARESRPRDWRANMRVLCLSTTRPVPPEPQPPLVVRATARDTRRTAWKEPSLSTVKLPRPTPRPVPEPSPVPVDRATARESRPRDWRANMRVLCSCPSTTRPVSPEPQPPLVVRATARETRRTPWKEPSLSTVKFIRPARPVSPPTPEPLDRKTKRETRKKPWKEPRLKAPPREGPRQPPRGPFRTPLPMITEYRPRPARTERPQSGSQSATEFDTIPLEDLGLSDDDVERMYIDEDGVLKYEPSFEIGDYMPYDDETRYLEEPEEDMVVPNMPSYNQEWENLGYEDYDLGMALGFDENITFLTVEASA